MPGRAEERRPRAPPPPVGRAHLKWDPNVIYGTSNVILVKSDGTELALKAPKFRGDPVNLDLIQRPDCISIPSMGIEIAMIIGFMHGGRAVAPRGILFRFYNEEGVLTDGECDRPLDLDTIVNVGCGPENRQAGGKRMKRKAKRSSKTRAKRSKSRRATRKA